MQKERALFALIEIDVKLNDGKQDRGKEAKNIIIATR